MRDKNIEMTSSGWRAVVTDDRDDDFFVGYWYGTFEECVVVSTDEVTIHPISEDSGVDEFDLACERRWD